MNHNQHRFAEASPLQSAAASSHALEARFALRVTARLTERSMVIAPDLNERLRFAREKALECARAVRASEQHPVAVNTTPGGALTLGGLGSSWRLKLASVMPVIALAAGLFMIQRWQENTQISTAAEVDAALLSDALPPEAYGDAGFAEFLKTPGE